MGMREIIRIDNIPKMTVLSLTRMNVRNNTVVRGHGYHDTSTGAGLVNVHNENWEVVHKEVLHKQFCWETLTRKCIHFSVCFSEWTLAKFIICLLLSERIYSPSSSLVSSFCFLYIYCAEFTYTVSLHVLSWCYQNFRACFAMTEH